MPPKVRKGLVDKIDELYGADPRHAHKALQGPLQGFYRIAYSRFRAIYDVQEQRRPNGKVVVQITVRIVVVGQRKAGDKKDVYKLAQRLVELGLIGPVEEDEGE